MHLQFGGVGCSALGTAEVERVGRLLIMGLQFRNLGSNVYQKEASPKREASRDPCHHAKAGTSQITEFKKLTSCLKRFVRRFVPSSDNPANALHCQQLVPSSVARLV